MQVRPRQVEDPVRRATAAMRRARSGSAHQSPRMALAASPMRIASERYARRMFWTPSSPRAARMRLEGAKSLEIARAWRSSRELVAR